MAFIPVILCGGAGSRLWPLSRETHPKPFMRLPDGESLIQKTMLRAARLPGVDEVLTVTNRDTYFQVLDHYAELKDLPPHRMLLEPVARNTAPAVLLAAHAVNECFGGDATLLILSADHMISDQLAFTEAVNRALSAAREGGIVVFGVRPTRPETGYGYIERAEPAGAAFRVARFVEKPDRARAEQYLAAGTFDWNAGIFCFTAEAMLAEAAAVAPELAVAAEACWQAATDRDADAVRFSEESFRSLPELSIDYAVMEKARRVSVVPAEFDWSDVGSFAALRDLVPADSRGNRAVGDAVFVDAKDTYVYSESRIAAAVGLQNVVIIDTPDALLVADASRTQDVKEVVSHLRERSHETVRYHRTVHRPWGTYTVLEEGHNFKIKRIVVKPGHALSLQMHYHRSEHWVVVSGTARVVNGDNELLVRANESTYIPAGQRHRLENPGHLDLVMIEVQSGEYLGEDDIVRFEDRYAR